MFLFYISNLDLLRTDFHPFLHKFQPVDSRIFVEFHIYFIQLPPHFYLDCHPPFYLDFHPLLPWFPPLSTTSIYLAFLPFIPWLKPVLPSFPTISFLISILPWFWSPSSLISTPFYHPNLPCFPPLYSLIKPGSTFSSNHFFLGFHLYIIIYYSFF